MDENDLIKRLRENNVTDRVPFPLSRAERDLIEEALYKYSQSMQATSNLLFSCKCEDTAIEAFILSCEAEMLKMYFNVNRDR